MMKYYPGPKMCSICGGRCCKVIPGVYSPSDVYQRVGKERGVRDRSTFLVSDSEFIRMLVKMILFGNCCVDYFSEEPNSSRGYYLRPQTELEASSKKVVYGNSIINYCNFLIPGRGCILQYQDRPVQCKMLAPTENGCNGLSNSMIKTFYEDWIPHTRILIEAAQEAIRLIDIRSKFKIA